MGWWKREGSSDMLGDAPLDILGQSVSAVVAEYHRELGRRPTAAEWEALLYSVLGADDDEYRPLDAPTLVSAVHLDLTTETE